MAAVLVIMVVVLLVLPVAAIWDRIADMEVDYLKFKIKSFLRKTIKLLF